MLGEDGRGGAGLLPLLTSLLDDGLEIVGEPGFVFELGEECVGRCSFASAVKSDGVFELCWPVVRLLHESAFEGGDGLFILLQGVEELAEGKEEVDVTLAVHGVGEEAIKEGGRELAGVGVNQTGTAFIGFVGEGGECGNQTEQGGQQGTVYVVSGVRTGGCLADGQAGFKHSF